MISSHSIGQWVHLCANSFLFLHIYKIGLRLHIQLKTYNIPLSAAVVKNRTIRSNFSQELVGLNLRIARRVPNYSSVIMEDSGLMHMVCR